MSKIRWVRALAFLCGLLLLRHGALPVRAAGTTWYVTSTSDSSAGNLATHSGTLRFVLANAQSGDVVRMQVDPGGEIYAGSTLVVPAGVSVGYTRAESCGRYATPLANIKASTPTLAPVVQLEAGATLRGLDIAGGATALRISGADADVCGVGIGVAYLNDNDLWSIDPEVARPTIGLIVDGPAATITSTYLNDPIVVSALGSDTRFGDRIDGSGAANSVSQGASMTLWGGVGGAAQRVLVRDPIPRALHGISGSGVPGGDDDSAHVNNWSGTPSISSALAIGAALSVQGSASPNALVDIFYDAAAEIHRQAPVYADASGQFSYSGPLPDTGARIFAVSTLADPAHPTRVGSSSQYSAAVQVGTAEPPPSPHPSITPVPPATAQLGVLGSVTNLDGPPAGPAEPGQRLRLRVTMPNSGNAVTQNIHSLAIQLPTHVTIVSGSSAISGGSGFHAADDGFNGGMLAPGAQAVYTLDVRVDGDMSAGGLVFFLFVGAQDTVAIPVTARMQVVLTPPAPTATVSKIPSAGPAPDLTPQAWLPWVIRP